MAKTSLEKSKIKILLLEGVHQSAVDNFHNAGYENIEHLPTSLDEESLIEKIRDVHFIGIRSRTQLTERVFEAAEKLAVSVSVPTKLTWMRRSSAVSRYLMRLTPTPAQWRSWYWQKPLCCCAVFPRRMLARTRAAG